MFSVAWHAPAGERPTAPNHAGNVQGGGIDRDVQARHVARAAPEASPSVGRRVRGVGQVKKASDAHDI